MEENQPKKAWWRDSVLIFTKASVWIALPLIIALFIGKFLDKQFGTQPWLFLGTLAIAFFLSCFGIVRTMKKEVAKMDTNKDGTN